MISCPDDYLTRSSLDLSYQNLTEVLDWVNKCKSLKVLYLDNNQLTSVPDFIELKSLEILDLRHNKLKSVLDFTELKSLEILG